MTIRHLQVFIKVCEFCSVSKTALELHVAQPSVSQTIKDLENYYEIVLFDRISNRLILTKEGKLLLEEAKEVVKRFEDFESLARKEDLNPEIKIGSTMTFGAFIIPKYNTKLKELRPKVSPRFYIDKPQILEEKVLNGDLDFAFVEGLINSKLLNAIEIGTDELIAICSPTFNAPTKLKLEELNNYDLFLREKNNPARKILDYQCFVKGIKLNDPLLESVSNNGILSMSMNGQGIGILPAPIARRSLELGLIRRIELDVALKRKLFIVSHPNKVFNKNSLKAYKLGLEILKR